MNNPELTEKKRFTLKPPNVQRLGRIKSCWTNFAEIARALKRDQSHIIQFFLTEMGTDGSVDSKGRFIIKGKYTATSLESLIRKYLENYVQCSICKNYDTKLVKDPTSRLMFVQCESCGSSRSVTTIKSGFHATLKADRKKARQ